MDPAEFPSEDDVPSDDSSACFADIGFMFDSIQPTKKQCMNFQPNNCSYCGEKLKYEKCESILVVIDAVDDHPGAVQSGHYLWPGAPALAQHLVDTYCSASCICEQSARSNLKDLSTKKVSFIELGAGCGLASLAAIQVLNVKCAVLTDHDPGTLSRARENHLSTIKNLSRLEEEYEGSCIKSSQNVASVPVFFERLSWGDDKNAIKLMIQVNKALTSSTGSENGKMNSFCGDGADKNDDQIEENKPSEDKTDSAESSQLDLNNVNYPGFDVVLGSDLIYCREVVRPLFQTIARLLSKTSDAIMIMTQSFSYEADTESEIDDSCRELGIFRSIVSCGLKEDGVRIQTFQFESSE